MMHATLGRMRNDYVALTDQEANLDELTRRLAEYASRALLVGCETGMGAADRLARSLHLPDKNPDTSRARRGKFAMHQVLDT